MLRHALQINSWKMRDVALPIERELKERELTGNKNIASKALKISLVLGRRFARKEWTDAQEGVNF